METNNKKRIDRILANEWDHAAASPSADMSKLRKAFEANELQYYEDRPVLVKGLTVNQADLISDCFPESGNILASGSTWILFEDSAGVADRLNECEVLGDEALERAMGNNIDMTDAQIEFTERSIAKSIKSIKRKLKKSLDSPH